MDRAEIFAIPIDTAFLIYAPFYHLAALVNASALDELKLSLIAGEKASKSIEDLLNRLSAPHDPLPLPRTNTTIDDPYYLGILPTRNCNMACRYCDFLNGSGPVMSRTTAQSSVDAYIDLLVRTGKKSGAIHFFGGEPFCAAEVVQFIVEYARAQSAEHHIRLHFEITTNGNYDDALATWAASHIDTIVLSLDGFAEAQNDQRPSRRGKSSFEQVSANAAIFSGGQCEFIIRSCISNQNVTDLPGMAEWMRQTFHPAVICFEPLTLSVQASANHLSPPDPLTFARQFCAAAALLQNDGIPLVLSTVDFSQNRVTACPVGNDALIVSPEGDINACYMLEKSWQEAGLDMRLGKVTQQGFQIDSGAVQRMHQFSVYEKPLCANCFCRFHCAGGCHVNHATSQPAGQYDDLCIRTRLVSAALVLDSLGQQQLRARWLADDRLALQTAWQSSDRLIIPGDS